MRPIFWITILLPVALLISTLWGNRVPLFAPPGPWVRLKTYLSSNWVCTAPDHPFPELRQPVFDLPAADLQGLIEQALQSLDWRFRRLGPGHLHAEAVTPLLRFIDDLDIRIVPEGSRSRLQLCSRSRVGRADFGANQRHIRELLEQLERIALGISH